MLKGGKENVVVVAGDAAFTCGISYEALNNVETTKRFIVVLNDNEWSIAKNVGAIANYLNSMAKPTYTHLHEKARSSWRQLPESPQQFAHKVEEGVKGLVVPSVIFEDLGLRYYGPIDGHDIPLLIRTFEFLKTQEEPVLLHILTKKGKGYEPAIASRTNFTASQNSSLKPAKPRRRRLRLTPSYSVRRSQNLLIRTTRSWPSRPRCLPAPVYSISPRSIRFDISMSALQKNTRRCSRVVWQRKGLNRF